MNVLNSIYIKTRAPPSESWLTASVGYLSIISNTKYLPTPNHPEKMERAELSIQGMTCTACSSAVEGLFRDEAGVLSVSVNLLMGRGSIVFDPAQKTADDLVEDIEDIGFEASLLFEMGHQMI